jgi:nucleoid-associated protein YgaU
MRSQAYVVRPGDTLWEIAAERLPRDARPSEVAAAAARWWSANRTVIGPDPNVLHPGQVLSIPSPTEAA